MVSQLLVEISVLFLMMALGFAVVRMGLLKADDSRVLTVLSVYVIIPAVIVNSFQIELTSDVVHLFMLAIAAAVLIHILLYLVAWIAGRAQHLSVLEKASIIYSNAGNLIIPLITAVLGGEWVIYASAFLCVQLIILWTHGDGMMRGERSIRWKRIAMNAELISIIIGLVLLITGIRLPYIATRTLSSISATLGPVSMIMIGMLIAACRFRDIIAERRLYLIVFLKMVAVPVLAFMLLRLIEAAVDIPGSRMVLFVSFLAVITPSAVTIVQMAQLYGHDARYASAINVMTTLASVITMPLFSALFLAGA